MRKVFFKILQFSAFLLATCFVLILVVASSTAFTPYFEKLLFTHVALNGDNYARTQDLSKWLKQQDTNRKRALMLGGSTIFGNINPNILTDKTGVDFFCAASNGQPFVNSLYILEHCINEGGKPDFLFLGIDHMLWDITGVECSFDWVVNNPSPNRKYVFNMVKHADDYTLWVYYPYFVIKRMLPFTKEYFEKKPYNDEYAGKGFSCYDDKRPQERLLSVVPSKIMSTSNWNAFNKIVEICKQENIRLILFVPKFLNYTPDTRRFTALDAVMINATTMELDSTSYYDNSHLRCRGTTPYTLWIAEEFNKNYR